MLMRELASLQCTWVEQKDHLDRIWVSWFNCTVQPQAGQVYIKLFHTHPGRSVRYNAVRFLVPSIY
ncbi:hypothetical protein KDH_58440 [Dictyobacter sp. S3.2.2.5]|uniref:Uncharacterized protein n=1 Tax=Dictyobacter halimunensis TaxID=3026934 RepID=A0ABQ6FZF1_9CHLR|nr:hypothetical protein KDH_58440 [Dictyobacter sp. S3.2.2.5]